MDEVLWMRLFGGTPGSGLDWVSVLAFLVVAVVYFLMPVLGYRFVRRDWVAASLYLLIGHAGVSLVQLVVWYVQLMGRPGSAGRGESAIHFFFGFGTVKMLLFVLAMTLFVVGLQRLQPRTPPPDFGRTEAPGANAGAFRRGRESD